MAPQSAWSRSYSISTFPPSRFWELRTTLHCFCCRMSASNYRRKRNGLDRLPSSGRRRRKCLESKLATTHLIS